jgi:flagellar FliL protein
MAETDTENEDLDLDVKPASGSKKKIIIMAVVGLLLIGLSVGLTVWLLGGKGSAGDSAKEEHAAEETVKKAQYLPLETMVVNFADGRIARYLQVDIQLMAYDPEVLKVAEEHMPVIRNDILVLLGSESYEKVSTREGKEELRKQILGAVNRILRQQAGEKKGVQAVYFTNFVMQ